MNDREEYTRLLELLKLGDSSVFQNLLIQARRLNKGDEVARWVRKSGCYEEDVVRFDLHLNETCKAVRWVNLEKQADVRSFLGSIEDNQTISLGLSYIVKDRHIPFSVNIENNVFPFFCDFVSQIICNIVSTINTYSVATEEFSSLIGGYSKRRENLQSFRSELLNLVDRLRSLEDSVKIKTFHYGIHPKTVEIFHKLLDLLKNRNYPALSTRDEISFPQIQNLMERHFGI